MHFPLLLSHISLLQHPYRLELDVPRLKLIVENSGCRVALTDTDYSLVIRAIYVKNLLSKVSSQENGNGDDP